MGSDYCKRWGTPSGDGQPGSGRRVGPLWAVGIPPQLIFSSPSYENSGIGDNSALDNDDNLAGNVSANDEPANDDPADNDSDDDDSPGEPSMNNQPNDRDGQENNADNSYTYQDYLEDCQAEYAAPYAGNFEPEVRQDLTIHFEEVLAFVDNAADNFVQTALGIAAQLLSPARSTGVLDYENSSIENVNDSSIIQDQDDDEAD